MVTYFVDGLSRRDILKISAVRTFKYRAVDTPTWVSLLDSAIFLRLPEVIAVVTLRLIVATTAAADVCSIT